MSTLSDEIPPDCLLLRKSEGGWALYALEDMDYGCSPIYEHDDPSTCCLEGGKIIASDRANRAQREAEHLARQAAERERIAAMSETERDEYYRQQKENRDKGLILFSKAMNEAALKNYIRLQGFI